MAISEADFEQLSQLLDGELDVSRRQQLEERLAREPGLAETWRQLQTVNTTLQSVYGGHGAVAVPTRVRAMLVDAAPSRRPAGNVVPLFASRRVWPAALAASLVLAVSIALLPRSEPGSGAQSALALASALETLPSGNGWHVLDDGRQIQPVLTFPSNDARWCREYLLRQADSEVTQRGVACRSSGDWHTEVLAQGTGPQSSDVYRPAGAGDNQAIEAFIRDHAADIPLDAAREKAIMQRDWR